MEEVQLSAVLNNAENPQTIYVHGTILTYRDDDKIRIIRSEPRPISETMLQLTLTVTEGKGPMKGTLKPFYFHLSGKETEVIRTVTVLYEDKELHPELKVIH